MTASFRVTVKVSLDLSAPARRWYGMRRPPSSFCETKQARRVATRDIAYCCRQGLVFGRRPWRLDSDPLMGQCAHASMAETCHPVWRGDRKFTGMRRSLPRNSSQGLPHVSPTQERAERLEHPVTESLHAQCSDRCCKVSTGEIRARMETLRVVMPCVRGNRTG